MKEFIEIRDGQILYTNRENEEFWDHSKSDQVRADGVLPRFTKIKVDFIDKPDIVFEILEGEFIGKRMSWAWFGESAADPEDLLTQEEYDLVERNVEVNEENYIKTIEEIEGSLSGIKKEKYKFLINYLITKSR